MSKDRPLLSPSTTVRWIDLPPSAEGCLSTSEAGVSRAVSSSASPRRGGAAARRVPSAVPGQTSPPGAPPFPGALIPPGAGGRAGGLGGGSGFSLRRACTSRSFLGRWMDPLELWFVRLIVPSVRELEPQCEECPPPRSPARFSLEAQARVSALRS